MFDIRDEAAFVLKFSVVKLSVLVVTYNHAAFIAQALDSALMQETNFPYEIIISEDCSSDGTREIVQGLSSTRFPAKTRLILSEHNVASNAVVARGVDAAQGRLCRFVGWR